MTDHAADEPTPDGDASGPAGNSPTGDDADREAAASWRAVPTSRRGVLGASAALVGGALTHRAGVWPSDRAATEKRTEACGSGATLPVGDGEFRLLNNDWGSADVDMCVWTGENGSYGYEWATRTTDGPPNYPQVLLGTKPWGTDTGVADFPVRRGAVDQFEMTVDIDVDVSGGAWNLAEEWWLLERPPGEETETHRYEIMLVLDWGGGLDHYMEERGVWTDDYGNVIDHWAHYDNGGTDAEFHIFRVRGGLTTGTVDLDPVIGFLSDRYGVDGELWLSGVELGTEYWQGAGGEVTVEQFDVTVDGTTYASGRGSDERE
jgi:hypothetical protein